MRKNILLVCTMFWTIIASSQTIQNGDFKINNGNDDPNYFTNCGGAFTQGSVYNWYKTHGTPHFEPCEDVPWQPIVLVNNVNSGAEGEGIAGEYHFKANEKYLIRFGTCFVVGMSTPSDKLMLKATSVLPSNIPAPPTCLSSVPVVSTGDIESVREFTSTSTPAVVDVSTSPMVRHKAFTFIPHNDRNYIWIFPNSPNRTIEINLLYLYVIPVCKDDLYFTDGTSGYIPTDDYIHYRQIFAGSQMGSNPSTPVATNPATNTSFIATQSILFEPNFIADVSVGGSFFSFVDPYNCDYSPDNNIPPLDEITDFVNDGGGDGTEEADGSDILHLSENNNTMVQSEHIKSQLDIDDDRRHTQYSNVRGNEKVSAVRLYPNPNNGSFTIEIPQGGDYDMRVVNIMGATVYQTKLKNERKREIVLKDKLAQGTYTVHLIGKNVNYVEKLTITK